MNKEFKIAINCKELLLELDELYVNYPKKARFVVNKMIDDSFLLLKTIIHANMLQTTDRLAKQKEALALLSMLDYYVEYGYKKQYISHKVCEKYARKINILAKQIYAWIKKDGTSNNP